MAEYIVAKWRKKPVVVQAARFENNASSYELLHWLNEGQYAGDKEFVRYINNQLIIPTLEGEMTASPGDWIIKGVAGEIYPCKDKIFRATYEAVGNPKRVLAKKDILTEQEALDLLDVMTPGDAILTLWRDRELQHVTDQQEMARLATEMAAVNDALEKNRAEIDRLTAKLITATDMLTMAVAEADNADEIEARLLEEIGEKYQP